MHEALRLVFSYQVREEETLCVLYLWKILLRASVYSCRNDAQLCLVHSAILKYKHRAFNVFLQSVAKFSCSVLAESASWVFGLKFTPFSPCIVFCIWAMFHLTADRSVCRRWSYRAKFSHGFEILGAVFPRLGCCHPSTYCMQRTCKRAVSSRSVWGIDNDQWKSRECRGLRVKGDMHLTFMIWLWLWCGW